MDRPCAGHISWHDPTVSRDCRNVRRFTGRLRHRPRDWLGSGRVRSVMTLTPEQSNTIRHWGEKTQHVNEIRLFGSCARGDGVEESDIDLAVTIGSDDPGTVLGIGRLKGSYWPLP